MAEEQENVGTTSPVVVELGEGDVKRLNNDDMSASEVQEQATRATLQEVDDSALEGAPSLVEMWDRVTNFRDTNELIRSNILKEQHLFEEAYEEHQRQKIEDNARLTFMLERAKADPNQADAYTLEQTRIQGARKDEREQLGRMANVVTGLAKEYRSCAMQRALFIHIALIQQFTLLITASIQRNVKDSHALRAIGEDIKQAKRVCFPTQEAD